MGGQACVFYGAAEFSRDTDIAVLSESENLARLAEALAELPGTVHHRATIRGRVPGAPLASQAPIDSFSGRQKRLRE